MGDTRKKLVWSIQKLLLQLSEDQLQELAKAISTDAATNPPDSTGDNETELFDYVVKYMNSEQLKGLEDEGLSALLHLQDIVRGIITGVASFQTTEASAEPETLPVPSSTDSRVLDTGVQETPPTRALETPPMLPSGLVRLSDVAALLPQREFKIFGGQISDTSTDMSYSNICKQVEDGLRANVPEFEVVRAVMRVIKPGALKDM